MVIKPRFFRQWLYILSFLVPPYLKVGSYYSQLKFWRFYHLEKRHRGGGRFSKRSNSSFTTMFCLAYFTIKSDKFFTIVCFLSIVLPRFVYHGLFARLFQRWNNLKMNAESFPKFLPKFLPKLIPDFVSKSRPDSGWNCRRKKYSVLFPP